MNIERMIQLRDAILTGNDGVGLHYRQNSWFINQRPISSREEACGSACCIAGTAVIMFGSQEDIGICTRNHGWFRDTAARLLELSMDEAINLFAGITKDGSPDQSGWSAENKQAWREAKDEWGERKAAANELTARICAAIEKEKNGIS